MRADWPRRSSASPAELAMPYILKAELRQANRTSIKSFRGPGLVEGHGS